MRRDRATGELLPISWEEARAERAYLPKKPAPNTFYGSFAWQVRIGHLLPGDEDLWW